MDTEGDTLMGGLEPPPFSQENAIVLVLHLLKASNILTNLHPQNPSSAYEAKEVQVMRYHQMDMEQEVDVGARWGKSNRIEKNRGRDKKQEVRRLRKMAGCDSWQHKAPGRQSARRWIADKSSIEEAEVDRLVGYRHEPPGDDWSAEDEAEVDTRWEASDMKVAIDILQQTPRPFLMHMWKICLRLRRCSPVSIISPINRLRYLPPGTYEKGYDYLYSKAFCAVFSSIIVHPCMRNIEGINLILILHYAIVTGTQDCTFWEFTDPSWALCPVIAETIRKVDADRSFGGIQSVHSLHKEARVEAQANEITPGFHSELLYHIGETVAAAGSRDLSEGDGIVNQLGREVLPLTLEDLKNVQRAIDTMQWPAGDDSYACTTTEALQSYNVAKKGRHEEHSFLVYSRDPLTSIAAC
ncbi:unnamed protein product [Fusarium venenatum]|uniref:Uncharacterized protein n=1 Tax=Fusarium venenatum TaxID=56646 RepID=A0A2L2TE90_9HYPO|nr:uncharacterized protein FVRRES_08366 [Fusarium venenatum]KAH6965148.1 hypothetical protein EDB82DRAFT_479518 [Fusarium venenatum]CEI68289.1 unnamed protein product [Fusarium venenatum]